VKEAINLEEKRRYVAKASALLFMALFLLACGPTPPAPKTVPVATRLVETTEAEEPTGNTVILFGKVIDSQTGEEIPLRLRSGQAPSTGLRAGSLPKF